ncbi:glycosyl hydrolase family 115 (putative glucuronidase) [Breznakibacter xylanolyticus]|uniref:Glycosyl hydrolase family 115 (Putative glucuronidase) n=1 Tax=Breznakibacter xylanolyticus TaxID=990 RepID=A0A2W7NC45_9BACT|nr:glycosyl hydrolase 115 family protein [Breznakibacter xylanolyticus]PZX10636.1 glycosyl hydrolase family 115 (putative glucuronidase) [Breznakibacter xylanolyticus]
MRQTIILLTMLYWQLSTFANVTFTANKPIAIAINSNEPEVVHTAINMFSDDYQRVFNGIAKTDSKKGTIIVGTLGMNSVAEKMADATDLLELNQHEEAFLVTVKKGKLLVLGSDKRGTAYGILELSRIIGVSPWVWWADASVEPKASLVLKEGFRTLQHPSVARRGIFINDEDWGLMPWSSMTYEPSDVKGRIGPKTHARIFELLLRLRANTFWPAMHSCSEAFYLTPGNKEVADKYGIYVGTSHCEPMMRNTNAEWKLTGTGEYNYLTNRYNVLKFWEERVTRLAGSDNIYTLGIRGVHDSKMLGANTLQEQKDAINKIIKDQRDMITRIVNPDVTKVSQVFIPYKEVLDVYRMGLQVPDDVTLMWTDDNYGYIRHFPDSTERARKGGNGIYNHVSYWGRPHDYLWLATNHPALVHYQMKLAYNKGAREMWILNVGDIKPAEYLIELHMDMAWNITAIEGNKQGLEGHLRNFLAREFGNDHADELLQVMNEYYRLAYIRKPEFMGNTRTEERDPIYREVKDLPWSENYIRTRINEYESIAAKVSALTAQMPTAAHDAWFQLIEYPVRGAAEMNRKLMYAQLARHGKADWQLSDAAYDTIVALTNRYNSLNNGKWNRMMDYRPRRLAMFDRVPRAEAEKPMVADIPCAALFNGNEYKSFDGQKPIELGLGYQRGGIALMQGSSVTYQVDATNIDSIKVEVALMPNHPVDGKNIRYAISVNNDSTQVIDYRTFDRSEEWKINMLTNQAIRTTKHTVAGSGIIEIRITAVDEGVVVDQVRVVK